MISFLIKQPRKYFKYRLTYKTIYTHYKEFESLQSLKDWQKIGCDEDNSFSSYTTYDELVEKI